MLERNTVVKTLSFSGRALLNVLSRFLARGIELERIARVYWALTDCGVTVPLVLQEKLLRRILAEQRDDGGWIGLFDTMWIILALRRICLDFDRQVIAKAIAFIKKNENSGGGWGRCLRDMSRVPVTGAIIWLVPEARSSQSYRWLLNEWTREWDKTGNEPSLTYKGAFTLLAFQHYDADDTILPVLRDTAVWLAGQQDPSGGFGPWKGHPIGVLPSITGLCCEALSSQRLVNTFRETLVKAARHLIATQIANGLWPDHYIDVGSAYAMHALHAVASVLEVIENGTDTRDKQLLT